MIKRVYFLKAQQRNNSNGTCHAFRTMIYKSWMPPEMGRVASEFFAEISQANELPEDGWTLDSFSRVR